jgi:hypothetical protein
MTSQDPITRDDQTSIAPGNDTATPNITRELSEVEIAAVDGGKHSNPGHRGINLDLIIHEPNGRNVPVRG